MYYKKYFEDNWDYRHFLAFMYIAIASSDYEISEEEKDELHLKLAPSIFDEIDYKEMYDEVLKVYNNMNDKEVFDFIDNVSKKFITNQEQKNKVLADLKDIIASDGHESGTETIMFITIKRILNNALV